MYLSDESKVHKQNRVWVGFAGWACDPPVGCPVVLSLLMEIHTLQSDP